MSFNREYGRGLKHKRPRSAAVAALRSALLLGVALACLALSAGSASARGRVSPPAGAPAESTPPTVFAVVGDFGMDNPDERAVADLVAGWSPAFVISAGDNFYGRAMQEGDSGNKYHEAVGRYYCPFLKDITGAGHCPNGAADVNRFFPVMGNHDYSDAAPSPSTYLGYFTLPGAGVASSNTSGNERYYDFVEGPVHFFMLNSNPQEPDGISSTSAQAQWLRKQLAASTSPWNIVVLHHPPYSSDQNHGPTEVMQWPFARWGADVVISGHAHDYERIMRDGIAYFVNGIGGADRYGFAAPVYGSAYRYNEQFGAQRVTATAGSLKFEFISADGVTQETYTMYAWKSHLATVYRYYASRP